MQSTTERQTGRASSYPCTGEKTYLANTLRDIVEDLGVTVEEFQSLL